MSCLGGLSYTRRVLGLGAKGFRAFPLPNPKAAEEEPEDPNKVPVPMKYGMSNSQRWQRNG